MQRDVAVASRALCAVEAGAAERKAKGWLNTDVSRGGEPYYDVEEIRIAMKEEDPAVSRRAGVALLCALLIEDSYTNLAPKLQSEAKNFGKHGCPTS
ncbi:hypothetical protein ACP70R_001226 [Stipagrostis hirtigluma subsp. patula]